MSRIPRVLEYLKTGFTAEAVSAAKFRAYAARADRDGLPNLAERWRAMATDKDELARLQLEAAGKIRGGLTDLSAEVAEERYENDVLYPKMVASVEGRVESEEVVGLFRGVIEAQRSHLEALESLRRELNASKGDVAAS